MSVRKYTAEDWDKVKAGSTPLKSFIYVRVSSLAHIHSSMIAAMTQMHEGIELSKQHGIYYHPAEITFHYVSGNNAPGEYALGDKKPVLGDKVEEPCLMIMLRAERKQVTE